MTTQNLVKVAQLCLTLCDPMDNTVHGIIQARILESVAFLFSWILPWTSGRTQISHIAGRFFTSWATREAQQYWSGWPTPSSVDLPNPGIKPGSPALQADSLPTELWGKLWLRLHTPNTGGLGSMPGWGTRPHMLQLRVHMPQQKPKLLWCTATKTWCSQINRTKKKILKKQNKGGL